MLVPHVANAFRKDLKRVKKQGKDTDRLKKIMDDLIEEVPLAAKHKHHPLVGNWANHRECHIQPDWLLIYRIEDDVIFFERTGSHSDLF